MASKTILARVIQALWNFAVLLVTKPKQVILGWLVAWSLLLYKAYASSGLISVMQLMMTSMMNFSSLFGLPVPLLSLLILFLESLAKLFTDFFMDKIVGLINFIKRKLFQAGDKIKKAFKRLKIKRRRLKMIEGDVYLGAASDGELEEVGKEHDEALEELLEALQLDGSPGDMKSLLPLLLACTYLGASTAYHVLPIPPRFLPVRHVRSCHGRIGVASTGGDVSVLDLKAGECLLYERFPGAIQDMQLNSDYLTLHYYNPSTGLHTTALRNLWEPKPKEITSVVPVRHVALTRVGFGTLCVSLHLDGAYSCFDNQGHHVSGKICVGAGLAGVDIDSHYVATCDGTNEIRVFDLLSKGEYVETIRVPPDHHVSSLVLQDEDKKVKYTSSGTLYEVITGADSGEPRVLGEGVEEIRRGSGFDTFLVKRGDYIGVKTSEKGIHWRKIPGLVSSDVDVSKFDVTTLHWSTGVQVFSDDVGTL